LATKALDPVADFGKPVKKQTLVQEEDANAEAAVRKGFALATFVKVIFERDKEDRAFMLFEISLPLTEEHRDWVPEEIAAAWAVVDDHGYKVQDIKVANQVAEIQVVPDAKDGALKIDTAEIGNVAIDVITEKGTGEDREVTRLRFRLRLDLDNETGRFARVHFGHPIWLKLEPLQRKLIK
jgi:hypothetical protein